MSVDLSEAIEWATRVVQIEREQGQSCHEYDFAAKAIVALHEENGRLRTESSDNFQAGATIAADRERHITLVTALEAALRTALDNWHTWLTAETRGPQAQHDLIAECRALLDGGKQ